MGNLSDIRNIVNVYISIIILKSMKEQRRPKMIAGFSAPQGSLAVQQGTGHLGGRQRIVFLLGSLPQPGVSETAKWRFFTKWRFFNCGAAVNTLPPDFYLRLEVALASISMIWSDASGIRVVSLEEGPRLPPPV
jgi:hypothetical protein